MSANEVLAYYTQPGPLSDAGDHRTDLLALPTEPRELLAAVQGLLVHQALTGLYGFDLAEHQRETAHVRAADRILAQILDDDQRPLTDPRDPKHRFACTCRTFTLVTVAALRAHGVPARARCGFLHYAPDADWYIDHWVAEYWDGERWILSDAQMDPIQVKEFGLDFDPADVPRDKFVVAGQAWIAYRAGELDADKCGLPGIPGESGPWWIAANLVRDAAALSNMELLPWDVWGRIPEPEDEIDADLTALFDDLAAVTVDPRTAADVRARYETDDRIRVPDQVRNAVRQSTEPVIPVD
ncbi:transglutaminase-like domain-containing protein [Glycomyces luteolus]|uniref:Transglutaminase-like domain-containing protein n=1 Tax=Glycomyces luteolus TaxID=2670330 RepID=A0A9X3SQ43_9ACTN|nr:transglutaminase-like domain-containing protein [Glycomyces luteolus]MDA1359696.1 transglutaminase-like domain-containing protein [Glycomyces luteolus]